MQLHLVTEKFDIVLLYFRATFKKDITQCFIVLQQNLYEKIPKTPYVSLDFDSEMFDLVLHFVVKKLEITASRMKGISRK